MSTFSDDILALKRTELTTKYKRSCLGEDGVPLDNIPGGFCLKALFSLTTDFLNGTSACNCSKKGSENALCEPIGGQCKCRANVIGRQCDKCKTGYYGFPYCKRK